MAHPMGTQLRSAASPVGLRIARLGRKRSQRFCLDFRRRPIPESLRTGGFARHVQNLDDPLKSQTDLAGNATVTYIDPVLCRTRLAQRKELPRSQFRQSNDLVAA
jgi:hypothetical protein